MSYYIRKVSNKRSHPHWKIQFITYKKQEAKHSKAKRPRREWDIHRDRWNALGFHLRMTLEQAKSRARQLNLQIEKKNQEVKRRKIERSNKKLEDRFTVAIPEIYKAEFEVKYIYSRYLNKDARKRFMTAWRASQRMLIDIPLDPVDWFDETFQFYDYFYKKRFSYSYIKKILLVTNLWGQFLSKRLGQPFCRIRNPRGTERARLLEAYFSKTKGYTNQSDPLTPEQLNSQKNCFKKEHYNWLYLSVWLGLRPQEIDQLKDEKFVRLQTSPTGIPVLWVYQTKLISVPPRYRWKLIPIVFKEQKQALETIRSGNFIRPRVKLIKKYFGQYTTLYGGRKGFTDLMMGKNQNIINISQWMGHSSIQRTWRNYKSRRIVHFNNQKVKA